MSRTATLTALLPETGEEQNWELEGDRFILGRRPPADIVLPWPTISRRHACITRTSEGYFIADLDSANGTFVNGKRVNKDPHRILAGDEIVLGGVVVLHFEDPEETLSISGPGRLEGIWVDEERRNVYVDGQILSPPLSAAQFALLALLYRQEGQVVSREKIIAGVWPDSNPQGVSKDALNALIKRLRHRLRATHPKQEYIEVLRGHGLRLRPPGD